MALDLIKKVEHEAGFFDETVEQLAVRGRDTAFPP